MQKPLFLMLFDAFWGCFGPNIRQNNLGGPKNTPKTIKMTPPPLVYRLPEVLVLELPLGFGVS